MNRLELLRIVNENMAKHIAAFTESVDDYKVLVVKISTTNLELANTGKLDEIAKIKSLPTLPVSYENSYKRAARMLELSVEDVIEVEEDVFNQLVLDEWDWKRSFIASNTMYKSGI